MPVTEADKPEKMWMVYTAPLVLGTDLEGDFFINPGRSGSAISLRPATPGTDGFVTAYG